MRSFAEIEKGTTRTMKSRLTTVSLVLGLSAFGVGGAYAGATTLGIVHGQAPAQHGKAVSHGDKALSHGKKHGLKRRGNALCHGTKALSHVKKHGLKHRGKALCHGKKHGLKHSAPPIPSGVRSSAAVEYGTRPGKGCGDQNHVHTGPPGNPSNTQCPPQSDHS
jgi:hypothetical protein